MVGRFVGWICFLAAVNTWAQMPHEVLLLVNKQSQDSLRVANTFVAARQVPARNVVYLDIPESIYGGAATITPEQFTQLIWTPANTAAKERGIEKQVLAWIYSVDFPIRVKTDPSDRRQMSVGGLTFARNKMPPLEEVEKGTYVSRLFGGPSKGRQLSLTSFSLRRLRDGFGELNNLPEELAYLKKGLGGEMPLPSMMLGYTGENGTDVETVLACIARGVACDDRGNPIKGTFFVTSDDVRSTCRDWQYPLVVEELGKRGIEATVTTNFPAGSKNVFGLMMGAETVDPASIESFLPGAMAEHLTSWSAEFQKPQTKLTDWIKAGATGSAGSVVEPYSIADKFPSARFFSHYAAGCTMLESFYQSVACPLQILLLGEPLACPSAPGIKVKVLGKDVLDKDFTYIASASSRLSNIGYLYSFYVDGKEVRGISDDPSVWIPIMSVSDGYHELRATARLKFQVECGSTVVRPFTVNRKNRSIAIAFDKIGKIDTYRHEIPVKLGSPERPRRVRLVCGEIVLDEKPFDDDVKLVLDEQTTGEGPIRIQAVAIYGDGMEVASEPLSITVTFAKDDAADAG